MTRPARIGREHAKGGAEVIDISVRCPFLSKLVAGTNERSGRAGQGTSPEGPWHPAPRFARPPPRGRKQTNDVDLRRYYGDGKNDQREMPDM